MARRCGGRRNETRRTRARGHARIAGATALLVLFAACSSSGGAGHASGGTTVAFAPSPPLHGDELVYGVTATRSDAITYQPDVVFLDGGAGSIKGVSADGLTWTVSGSAGNVDQLQPGKIMVATNYGVGRILAVAPSGSDKRVALGPVSVTDIIKDGTLASAKPIPLTGFVAYDVSGQPGLLTDRNDASTSSARTTTLPPVRLLAYTGAASTRRLLPAAPSPGSLPAATPTIPDTAVGDYHVHPFCCSISGVNIGYSKNGARLSATAQLILHSPTVDFSIAIKNGNVVTAGVHAHGAAGLLFDLNAAILNERGNFKSPRVQVPIDIQIPISAGPIPMTIGLEQIFSLGLGLSGRASLQASGEYSVGGSLGFSVANGVPKVEKPRIDVKKSILSTLSSLSIGPDGLDLQYALKISIGVGTIGFTAGAWYQFQASIGVATSGTPGTALVTCKSATLALTGRYGVGYSLPPLVASAVNVFLKAIFDNPTPIKPSDGPKWGPDSLFERATPPCAK